MADGTCPRCGRAFDSARGALSRTDNETKVCDRCGMDEALQQMDNRELPPQSHWPVPKKYWGVVVEPNGDTGILLVDGTGEGLRSAIGGWLEAHPIRDHEAHVYVDEEGRLKDLLYNETLSVLTGLRIVGRGVVLGSGRIPDEDDCPAELAFGLGCRPHWP